jgi:hypothetical protein
MSAPDPRRRSPARVRVIWAIAVVYVVLIAGLAVLAHALGGDVWSAIAPGLGGFIGFLLLLTPPARRWLDHLRRSRTGVGPHEHSASSPGQNAPGTPGGRQRYPVPSLRVVLLLCLGVAAFLVGVTQSVGRVPPIWAALLAGVGAVMLTVGTVIYFVREAGR